jgi:hypothetical protein
VTQTLPIRRPAAAPASGGRQQPFTSYDPFDLLALRFLGQEQLYWFILDANGRRLPAEFAIGETITIPPADAATQVNRGA